MERITKFDPRERMNLSSACSGCHFLMKPIINDNLTSYELGDSNFGQAPNEM